MIIFLQANLDLFTASLAPEENKLGFRKNKLGRDTNEIVFCKIKLGLEKTKLGFRKNKSEICKLKLSRYLFKIAPHSINLSSDGTNLKPSGKQPVSVGIEMAQHRTEIDLAAKKIDWCFFNLRKLV